jgi:hypothetical protein
VADISEFSDGRGCGTYSMGLVQLDFGIAESGILMSVSA